ncbi:MAG: carboxypeptidase regulatory-like domain-containing protein [Terracidiphilus sp.]
MSDSLQFSHPDADQIGAFVERALPAHERDEMLGHLAICPECRAVVALSLPEVEEPMPTPQVVARQPWWFGWRVAWPVATAFAALVLIFIHLHSAPVAPSAPPPNQIARVNPPALITPQAEEPAAPANHRALSPANPQDASRKLPAPVEPKQNPVTPIPAHGIESFSLSGRDTGSLNEIAQATILQDESLKKSVKTSAAPRVRVSGATGAASGVAGGMIGADAKSQPQETFGARSAAKIILAAPQETNATAMQTPAPTSRSVIEMRPFTANAESAADAASREAMQAAHFKHPLPSHLPVLSMATLGGSIVAIDTNNAVFLSKDDGKHWKAVHAPWLARPVKAQLAGFTVSSPAAKILDSQTRQRRLPSNNAAPSQIVSRADAAPLASYSSATLTGAVMDQTGAVIADASVAVMNVATGATRAVKSDRTGLYFIDGLAPGSYRVEAQARGFEKEVLAAVDIAANHQNAADLHLNIGAETQTVSVVADAIALQTDTSAVPALIEEDRPPILFEIITDSGERWTSADGLNWLPK